MCLDNVLGTTSLEETGGGGLAALGGLVNVGNVMKVLLVLVVLYFVYTCVTGHGAETDIC
jgi:hypothetical protein